MAEQFLSLYGGINWLSNKWATIALQPLNRFSQFFQETCVHRFVRPWVIRVIIFYLPPFPFNALLGVGHAALCTASELALYFLLAVGLLTQTQHESAGHQSLHLNYSLLSTFTQSRYQHGFLWCRSGRNVSIFFPIFMPRAPLTAFLLALQVFWTSNLANHREKSHIFPNPGINNFHRRPKLI